MAEVQFYFSIFSFTKLKKVELRKFLQDPRVDTSNCFIFVNGKKITQNLIEEVRKEVARSKFRIIILHDESTLEDELVKELLDLDTSTRNNTLLIIVPPPEVQNENSHHEDQNETAPREEQKEKPYNTEYISSYDKIGKFVSSFLDCKEYNQSEGVDIEPDVFGGQSNKPAALHKGRGVGAPSDFSNKNQSSGSGLLSSCTGNISSISGMGSSTRTTGALRPLEPLGLLELLKYSVTSTPAGKDVLKNTIAWTLIILLLSSVVYLLTTWLLTTPVVSNEISIVDKFTSRIKELKSEMVDQDEKLWRVVRSMKHHINDSDPRQPAVLMLVSTKKASENRENLAREIAEAYSVRCSNADYVIVNGADYTNMNDDDAKLEVDEKILEKFSAGTCATVISNFEKLPPASTKIFYQFCENDNAQYKNVIVIFTLEIEDGPWDVDDYISAGEESTPNSKNWNEIVDQYLHYSLKNRDKTETMNIDMISPLLSRITPAVAWVGSK